VCESDSANFKNPFLFLKVEIQNNKLFFQDFHQFLDISKLCLEYIIIFEEGTVGRGRGGQFRVLYFKFMSRICV